MEMTCCITNAVNCKNVLYFTGMHPFIKEIKDMNHLSCAIFTIAFIICEFTATISIVLSFSNNSTLLEHGM